MANFVKSGMWIRRALCVAVIVGVIVFAPGRETNSMTEASFVGTARGEQRLINPYHISIRAIVTARAAPRSLLTDDGPMPGFKGGVAWLNSAPESSESLRGKVVLINFWTYTCINSLRALPYVKTWATKYQKPGLVVIGVHTPEFSFEKDQSNVEAAMRDLHVVYPVVMDNNYRIWQDFNNQYWPAFYIIDAKGRIRYEHFGEGDYDDSERVIQELLKENGAPDVDWNLVNDFGRGIEAPPSDEEGLSGKLHRISSR